MASTLGDFDLEALRADLGKAGCGILGSEAIRRWNGALDPHPMLAVRCDTATQVSSAVRIANRSDIPLCVYNGGQDWNGRSLRNDSLVLDLSHMAAIEIDAGRREATIGGGVTTAQLNHATGKHGLIAVIGNDGAVSMAGLTLGGGYGPLMTRFGLACDNLLSAEIVLPDGTITSCDAAQSANVFWGLRGGGGNFGIVTSMRLRLHALSNVLAGNLVFPWTDAQAVLAYYAEMMLGAPAELFGAVVLSTGPAGEPVIVVSLVWSGEAAEGELIVAKIAAAGQPILVKAGPVPASSLLSLTDGKLAQGLGYEVATRWFQLLTHETINTLLAAFETRSSPLTSIIVHHCHGAATEVKADATAFGMRDPHFTALIYAAWNPPQADAEPHRAWIRLLDSALATASLPGGYANLLSDEVPERVRNAFGANAIRLARVKADIDPTHVLSAIPLPAST
jgi:FAD/FMN-containing dehydrogenase